MRFWRVRFRGLRAPAASALRRGQGAPFPAPLFSASGALPPLGSGQVSLDEAEHFRSTIEKPASIRSDGVLDHPGMPFGFPPERAFSFTGIPKVQQLLISRCRFDSYRAHHLFKH